MRARADGAIARTHSIIEPLASRCSKFRFKPLDTGSTERRVEMIRDAEGVALDEGVRGRARRHWRQLG